MNHKKGLLIILLIFAALMVGATVLYNNLGDRLAPSQLATQPPATEAHAATEAPAATEVPAETQPKPQQLPDFIVYDIDGNEVHLHDYFGKPIVLNFWASWCGPCTREMPGFNEVYKELGEEIQFLMVNVTSGRETFDNATAYLSEQGFEFPVFFDLDMDATITYGVSSLPMTLFIDAEGYLVAYTPKAITEETLLRGIDMIR